MRHDFAAKGFKQVVFASDDSKILKIENEVKSLEDWRPKSSALFAQGPRETREQLAEELRDKMKLQDEKGVKVFFWKIKETDNLAYIYSAT